MAVSAEVIATLVFGVLMALIALGAMVQAAVYAARSRHGKKRPFSEQCHPADLGPDEGSASSCKENFELE